jgi:hypothetical protein
MMIVYFCDTTGRWTTNPCLCGSPACDGDWLNIDGPMVIRMLDAIAAGCCEIEDYLGNPYGDEKGMAKAYSMLVDCSDEILKRSMGGGPRSRETN